MEKTEKYKSTQECEKLTGIKARKVAELCGGGEIDGYKTKSNTYMVNIDSLQEWQNKHLDYTPKPKFLGNPALAFGDLELDFDTYFKPILSANKDDEIFSPMRNEYQLRYWIANNGRVFDSDVGIYLQPDIKNGYYYVNLKRNHNKYEHFYIHYGVAYYFCKGWLVKDEVHHIDKNPLNNHSKNLIWVTKAEHRELHKLLKNGDKKGYRKRIREIRKENKKW
ncbi:MAG TPA: hypothetical protein DE313_01685 [Ruminococcus sp.]|nr:hypothetical protein [Ruminococcus sp.]